jgi:DNA-binding transcriptional MocR family regulator
MDWKPILPAGKAPIYERLVAAIEQDVKSGGLPAGRRLPPQRELAYRLKLSVGTVTKAYAEGERRGLLLGHVGRGTYVAGNEEGADSSLIDLSLNIIPHSFAARRLSDALLQMRRSPDLLERVCYAPPSGALAHRQAAAAWIRETAGYEAEPARMLLTVGGQHALSLAFGMTCRANDVVLCEAATFFGMKSIAEQTGLRLHGIEMDADGLVPSALEKAFRQTQARVLYTMPTLQNPTVDTMSASRRKDIARIIRRHKLWVVEDDAYAVWAPGARLPALAELVPEHCFYVGGISKSIGAGLRLGFLVCPPGPFVDQAVKAIRSTMYAPPNFGAALFCEWVENGTARQIAQAVRGEIAKRAALAREIMGGVIKDAPHFWLAMPELESERLAARALRAGVAVTPPSALIVPGAQISGVRICLGAAMGIAQLSRGLDIVRSALQPDRSVAETALV